MITFLRVRLTYANVTATLALFVALGGSSYAAISITGRDVRDRSLTGADLARGSIGSAEIRDNSLRGVDIRNGTVAAADLAKPLRHNLLAQRVESGPPGPQGERGPQGDTGPKGDAGPKGDIGPKGDAGPAGAQGAKGDTGSTGPKGDTGTTGSQGPKGDTGAIGPQGPQGGTGPQGPPGPSDVNASVAGEDPSTAATFSFGGDQRVSIGQQGSAKPPLEAGSGFVDVGSENGRHVQLGHYWWGSTLAATGPDSHLFEFLLGNDGSQPQLSVRNNGTGLGASVQARNADDTSGIVLDYLNPLRPRLHLEDDSRVPGAVLAIENPQPGGAVTLATGQPLADHLTLDPNGALSTDGNVAFGNQASDKVLFHGATGSGAQGTDPGALDTLTAADAGTPEDIAKHMNEQRDAINALRQALLQQGLVGPAG